MNSGAPMSDHRRGLRRCLWAAVALLLVAAFPAANLWLASSHGRNWVAGKIQRRCGLETRVGRASITPWSGIHLHDVALLQPTALRAASSAPLASFKTIRLDPVWMAWLHGRRTLHTITLDTPRFMIPTELLANLARKNTRPPGPAPTTTAPPIVLVAPTAPPPFVGPPAPPAAPGKKAPAAPEPAPAPQLPPTSWLHVKNASITLFSASSGKKRLQITGLHSSLPIAGATADSTLRIRSAQLLGQPVASQLSAPLHWNAPTLSLGPIETAIQGFDVKIAAKVALRGGLPIHIEAVLPLQKLPATELLSGIRAQADGITASSRFRGLLLAPVSWQGNLVAQATAPSGHATGRDAAFDRGSAVVVLRGGILACTDARLIGDDLSLLGNAALLADGRAAAALRIVAPPDTLNAVVRQAVPDLTQAPSLTPLSTGQRAAFDLEAFGIIGDLSLRLGKDGPVIRLNP